MEISSIRGLAELGTDDPLFFNQWPVSSIEGLSSDLYQSFSQLPIPDSKRAADSSQPVANGPLKHLRTTSWDSFKSKNTLIPTPSGNAHLHNPNISSAEGIVKPKEEVWPYSGTLSFPSEPVASQSCFGNQNFILKSCQGPNRLPTNTGLPQAQDHILAERKRREKLSQKFIALAALVPGLKKMDKASVLGDAIKYMKQLQGQVKILEEQTKRSSMESVVFVKKYKLHADDEDFSSDEAMHSSPVISKPLPEIEARFCNKDVLLIIHCEKRKGVLEKAVAEIERLPLSVVNSSVMTFGDSALNITLIAQKDEEFTMNMKELVKNLRGALEFI